MERKLHERVLQVKTDEIFDTVSGVFIERFYFVVLQASDQKTNNTRVYEDKRF